MRQLCDRPGRNSDIRDLSQVATSSQSTYVHCGEEQLSPSAVQQSQNLVADPAFLKDLLHKANGDHTKVVHFLGELGLSIGQEHLKIHKSSGIPENYPDDIDSAAAEVGAPDTFFCPISFHLFRDPVLLPTGQTYERCAIQRWLSQGHPTCPVTGVLMKQPVTITPNVALRRAIEEWGEKHAPWLLGPNGKVVPIPPEELPPPSNGEMNVNRDYAVALRLQAQEMTHRLPVRNGNVPDQSVHAGLACAEAKRMSRCLNLLWLITALHLAMFFTSFALSGWKFEKLDVNPLIGFSAKGLSRAGATNYPAIVNDNEWWRIIASVFLNAGFIHLEATLAALWTFGRFLAANMSFVSIATLYLVSGLGGVLISANFATDVVTAGASGAVFGLMGTVLCAMVVHKGTYRLRIVTFIVLLGVGVTHAVIGLTPLLDNWCAIGGLVCGILTGGAIMLGQRHGRRGPVKEMLLLILQILFSVMAVAIFVTAIVGLLIKFDSSGNCSWCSKITCVNTRWWNCEAATILPGHCAYDVAGDFTTKITCPSGETTRVQVSQITQEALEQHCRQICDVNKPDDVGSTGLGPDPDNDIGFGGGFVPINNTA